MYDQDTFFQLSMPGQAGLALLSTGLAFIMVWLTYTTLKKIPRLNPVIDMALQTTVAVALFWFFLWLSPQIYYTYYLTIIDNLPWQNVIASPPSPRDLIQILFFQNTGSFSQHAKAILGWIMIFSAALNTHRRYLKTPE